MDDETLDDRTIRAVSDVGRGSALVIGGLLAECVHLSLPYASWMSDSPERVSAITTFGTVAGLSTVAIGVAYSMKGLSNVGSILAEQYRTHRSE